MVMIVLGADMHKGSHSLAAVAADTAELLGDKNVKVGERGFAIALEWARGLGAERVWTLEDCRRVSGSFERFLLANGERVVRVAARLMAGERRGGRERGKSVLIDAQPTRAACEISVGVICRRPGARGVDVVESTRIALLRLEWPPRVARARRDGRGGSSASGRPRDVGPRLELWRALERERDAAFEPPPFRTRICLSRVLTPPVGETRRRISNIGGVAMVVSRDATLRS